MRNTAGVVHQRHRDREIGLVLSFLALSLFLLESLPVVGSAQSITSSGLNTQVNLSATPPAGKVQYDITGGTRPGNGANLFHSFGEFGVPANNIANFHNGVSFDLNGTSLATGLPTANILARVTGPNGNNPSLSSIYGTIQTTGFGTANLFLINPAGFLFGPNATVNVGGMVAFTSADYLKLTDNARFNAIPNTAADALLTALPVASFGFLGSNPGAITVQGSQLSVTDGQGISLVGGNISIGTGTSDGGTAQPAQLSAPNGKIQLASAASPGEFDAATLRPLPNLDGASFTSFGSMTLASGSNINVSGENTVSIRGGHFIFSVNDSVLTTSESVGLPETISLSRGSSIMTSNSGTDPGADVQLIASNVQMDGASIRSTTIGDGPGGNISITNAQTVNLTTGAQIVSNTEGGGAGGNIIISTTNTPTSSVTISGFDSEGTLSGIAPFGVVTSGVFSTTLADGNGGQISITAPTVTLDNAGTLATITSGDGRGGNISVDAQMAQLTNGAQVLSSNGSDLTTGDLSGGGRGGDITVTASDSIVISGINPDLFLPSRITSQTFNGERGGNIQISAPTVALEGGATIFSDSEGAGAGGNVTVIAPNQLSVSGNDPIFGGPSQILTLASSDGQTGAITVTAGTVNVADGAFIQTNGNSGDLTFHAQNDLNITDGAIIASVGGGDSSGNISIAADRVLVSGQQNSSPSRIENINGGQSKTGDIALNVRELILTDNARINSVSGARDGNIVISATESVTVSDGAKIRMENQRGVGSLIDIAASTITLDQGIIQTQVTASGDAGSVHVQADSMTLLGGFIDSTTNGFGQAGAVAISVRDNLTISGQFVGSAADFARPAGIYASTQSIGEAGSISVNAGTVELSGGARIENSSTGLATGNAGPITISAPSVVLNGGVITTSTETKGNAGDIDLNTNSLSLSNGGQILSSSLLRTAPLFPGEQIPVTSGASGTVTVQGLHRPAQSVMIDGPGSGLFTETQGTGAGRNITVWTNQLQHANGATISAKTTSSGIAGNILVKADAFSMSGGATITAASTGSGNAGTVTIEGTNSPANSVVIDGAGTGIFTNTQGSGTGGNITINTTTMTMQNGGTISAATTGTDESAIGGNITITASQSVDLRNNASVSARSTGDADAGNITINAGNRFEARSSSVTTKSEHAGGGNVAINATDQIRLVNSQVNASAFLNGGNIRIDPNVVVLQNSQILAQAIQGNGGNITITTPLFLADSSSLVSASSQFGLNGTVTIQSPTSNLSGSLGTLPSNPSEAHNLLTQRCTALANGQASSFVVAGREQLPADPGGWLSGPIALAGIDAERFGEGTVAEGTSHLAPRTSGLLANDRVLLRRLTPAGFLIANFADSEATGCHS